MFSAGLLLHSGVMGSVRTDADKPSSRDLRFDRMKHLRIDRVPFADMFPVLLAEGFLPDHAAHENLPTIAKGFRSDERNAEVCARCEQTIGETWRANVHTLTIEEVGLTEARWQWFAAMDRLATQAWKDYRTVAHTKTAKRKRLLPKAGEVWTVQVRQPDGTFLDAVVKSEDIEGKSYVVETIERDEAQIHPQLLELIKEIEYDVARLRGVQVGEIGTPIGDPEKGDNTTSGELVIEFPASRRPSDRPN